MVREKIRYGILCVFLGVMAVLYNEYITSVLFIVSLFIPAVLWAVMEIVKRHLDISLSMTEQIVRKGEPFQIKIGLCNHTIVPVLRIQIEIAYQNMYTGRIHKEQVYAALDAKSRQSIEAKVQSDYCGNVTILVSKVFLYDPLGIFKVRKKGSGAVMVSVLPMSYPSEKGLIRDNPHVMTEGEVYSDQKAGDDPSEIFGIREYRYGDRMNRIHWKLTEKEGSLMVKELGLPLNCEVLILTELPLVASAEEMLRSMDVICTCVFALSSAFLENGTGHYIGWYDAQTACIRRNKIEKEEELYEMMGMLFEAKAPKKEENAPANHEAEYPKEQYASIYYITAKLTEEKADSLIMLAKNAWCHIINAGDMSEGLSKYLECLPTTVAQVREESLSQDIINMMPYQEEVMQI